ncbi:MAG TPA: NACHT domain-containing protein, partial [Urbifossiella sp.]|nr:NACHT domain-containing protein [Urbifossiella sp.]
ALDRILSQLDRIETQTSARDGDQARLEYEKEYRAAVVRKLDWVELVGVTLPSRYHQLPLQDAFVSLDLDDEAEDNPDSDDDAITTRSCEEVFDALGLGCGRLLIEGPAGSGKTTLMRWVAITAAPFTPAARNRRDGLNYTGRPDDPDSFRILDDGEVQRLRTDWRNRVPFLIVLRNTEGRFPSPEDFPVRLAQEIGTPPASWVRGVLQEGRAIVLIDGVDEVPLRSRNDLRADIQALVEAYPPENYFLVTTRPDVVDAGWLRPTGFREVSVSPMGPDEVDRFVDQWHAAYARRLVVEGHQKDLTAQAAKLKRDVRREPALAQLATNPLMCGMICALNDHSQGKPPQSLSGLCRSLCDMFLHGRDDGRDLPNELVDPEYERLKPEQKRAALKQLAVRFVEEGKSALPAPLAEKVVRDQLAFYPGSDPTKAAAVFRGLLERSGMLRESYPAQGGRPAEIEFIHNTFKEYLAGEWFAAGERITQLLEKLNDPGWQKVTLFAVRNDQYPGFATQVIRKLLAMGKNPDLVFALQCQSVALLLERVSVM